MGFKMYFILIAVTLTSLTKAEQTFRGDQSSKKLDDIRTAELDEKTASGRAKFEPKQFLLPEEKVTSIDYSNRICPEYFGLRNAECPKCVPRPCITESDILCPYDEFQHCTGICRKEHGMEMACYTNCENRPNPKRFSPFETPRSVIWPNITNGGIRIIPYAIERLPELYEDDRNFAWLRHIEIAMDTISNGTDFAFAKTTSSRVKYANNGRGMDITRHIKIVETACLCGVNRVGRKPDDGNNDEVNETIIYYPTWDIDYVNSITTIYNGSKDVKHYPYELPVDENKLTCSYFESSIYHLLLHALGFGHTNNRGDRDNFVFVNNGNIPDDFPETSIGRFFDTYNVETPMVESYARISTVKSVMYMDGMAWGKHAALTVFSPIVDEVYPLGWQKKFEDEDRDRINLLYGTEPKSLSNPCWVYERSARLTPEERSNARDVKKCDDLIDSKTTIRTTSRAASHFGAAVSYACLKDSFVMLGDETRRCSRNGEWTGTQPICMPPDLVNSYCTYSSDNSRCKPFSETKGRDEKKAKRSSENYYKQFESEFESNEMNSTTDVICIGFAFLFQQNSDIEVYLKQNELWTLIWNEKSAPTDTVNNVQFETTVEKEKMFKVKVVGRYANDAYVQFYMKYFYVFSGSCNFK